MYMGKRIRIMLQKKEESRPAREIQLTKQWYRIAIILKLSKKSPVSGLRASPFFGYETMSNCSQNCWIDWNSAVLCLGYEHLPDLWGLS